MKMFAWIAISTVKTHTKSVNFRQARLVLWVIIPALSYGHWHVWHQKTVKDIEEHTIWY